MIKVNIHEIKTHFSEYLTHIEAGETIIICKRNVPIAEIHGIPHSKIQRRPIGLAKKTFEIPETFFEPLPDEIIDSFKGKSS